MAGIAPGSVRIRPGEYRHLQADADLKGNVALEEDRQVADSKPRQVIQRFPDRRGGASINLNINNSDEELSLELLP